MRLGQMYRAAEYRQQAKMTNIADEYAAHGRYDIDSALQHQEQVIDIRKILNHRVQNDRIERVCLRVPEFRGFSAAQLAVLKPLVLLRCQPLSQPSDG